MMVQVYHSDRFVPPLPEGHRFPMDKYHLVREQLLYEGTLRPDQLVEASPVCEDDILAVHTPGYWAAVSGLALDARAQRRIGFPLSPQLVERSRRSCQGTVAAACHALAHGIGLNLAGGTHHAYADHGEGFCLLNDMAIAAHKLLATGAVRQVLIVDLDVHQGNGTARIFAGDDRVFTFSMHGAGNYPLRKERSDLDLALPDGTGDAVYLQLLRTHLPRLIAQVRPDLIFYQAGVDVLVGDRLGKLALSREGCRARDCEVLETCHRHQIPVVVAMGGGYSARLSDTVEAHAHTFRTAVALYG
ncbi:MAG: histone deacetylase [Bacteroidia bacterium]